MKFVPSFIRVRNRINLAHKQINTDCLLSVANKLAVLAQPDTHRRSALLSCSSRDRVFSVMPSPLPQLCNESAPCQCSNYSRTNSIQPSVYKECVQNARTVFKRVHHTRTNVQKSFFLYFCRNIMWNHKQINYVIFSLKLTYT